MMYATYDYYTGIYGGTVIAASAWPRLSKIADAYIDTVTFGRLQRGAAVTEGVKTAVCAVAEVEYRKTQVLQAVSQGIQSETVDGYSITYESASTAESRAQQEIQQAINLWIPPSDPLRYAGV